MSRRSFPRRRKAKSSGWWFALAGVVMLFAGGLGIRGLLLIAVLYAVHQWKAPRTRPVERCAEQGVAGGTPPHGRSKQDLGDDAILEQLDRLVAQARAELPDELVAYLYSVRCSIVHALPWLVHGPSHEADLYTVRETVRRYLPDTLTHYFALPLALRSEHAGKDGKTAQQLLAEQLALLDGEMRQIASRVAAQDVQALRANGRFLEARFGRPDVVSG
jgi:hypothetical protein